MDKESIKATIQSLEAANKEYDNKYHNNESLIHQYQWELYYRDIYEKQMEIVRSAFDKDIFVFIFPVYSGDVNDRSFKEPEIKGFRLDKMDKDYLWIAKLKSDEFDPFNDGLYGKHLVGLTDVYYVFKSHRLDEGDYRVSWREHDNWGVFGVDRYRINIFNRNNFRDKELLEYFQKLTKIAIK